MVHENLEKMSWYTPDSPAHRVNISFFEELEKIWGKKWGAASEIGKLKLLMIQDFLEDEVSPEARSDPHYFLHYDGLPNVEKAQKEWQAFKDAFESEGVKIVQVRPERPVMGAYTTLSRIWAPRDYAIIINGGALISRMSLPWRKGLERIISKRLIELGCPILYTVTEGTLEGGDWVWLDPEHVLIGLGPRTDMRGIEEITPILQKTGVKEVTPVPLAGYMKNMEWPAGGAVHLDMAFGLANEALGVIYPGVVSYSTLDYLKEKEINLIEVSPDDFKKNACNFVAIEPGKIVASEGPEEAYKQLRKEGVDIIEVPFYEFAKSGGGPHCGTCPLIRDPGPYL